MRVSLATVLTTLVCASEALLYNFEAPSAIKPGDTVDLTLLPGSPGLYEKIVYVAVAFGWSDSASAKGTYAGVPLGTYYIGTSMLSVTS